jgi:Tfp pilus assembly protein PilN
MQTFQRIDLLRLSGIESVVGVDMTEKAVRMVVLRRHGTVFNKYRSRFSVEASGSVHFREDEVTPEQKAGAVKHLLLSRGITTRHAISTLRSLGMKTVTATVPATVRSIDEWISERYEKLVKLPLSLKEVSYQYEILEATDTGKLVEITFVRNSDIEAHKAFLNSVGLHLLALGAGVRDVINAVLIAEPSADAKDTHVVHVEGSTISVLSLRKGKRSQTLQVNHGIGENESAGLSKVLQEKGIDPDTLFVTGSISPPSSFSHRMFEPFGLAGEFALATGLALKGFLPELSPTNFLNEKEKEHFAVEVHRSLSKRLALGLGTVLFLLLFTQVVVVHFIEAKANRLDEELAASGSDYAEIATLEQQVASLDGKLNNKGKSSSSEFARTMHELAEVTPENVWLTKLILEANTSSQSSMTISGFTRSNEHVADFLKRLQKSSICSDVKLVRSGSSPQSEGVASTKSNGIVWFEVAGTREG